MVSNESAIRYGVGAATGLAAVDGVALVAAEPSSPTVEMLSAALVDGRPIVGVLAQLMAGNPDLLPPFFIARREPAGLRVVLRGGVDVQLHTVDGPEPFTATGLSTWREELFADVLRVEASVDASAPLAYAVSSGSFPVGRMEWVVGPAPSVVEATASAVSGPGLEPGPELAPGIAPEPTEVVVLVPDSKTVVTAVPTPDLPSPPPESAPPPPEPPPPSPVLTPLPASPVATPVPPSPVPGGGGIAADVDDLDFSHLVERTVYRQVEDAAVRVDPALAEAERHHRPPVVSEPPPPPSASVADRDATIIGVPGVPGVPPSVPTAAPSPAERPGDHDGHTVMRRSQASAVQPVVMRSPGGRPSVLAVRCPQGHPNPPQTPECRVCRQSIASRATESIERPTLGVLRFSTGLVVPVNGPLAVGRRPPDDQMLGAEVATGVAIDNSELSRFHAALLVNDWYVQLVDQGSTNGTMVSIPGQSDQVLRPNERVQLAYGCVINLGGAVSATFDVV